MPRPITMTDSMKQKALTDFASMLNNVKMSDGKLNYKHSFVSEACEKHKAIVLLTPEAYRKTVALLTEFSSEVAWHGSVSRSGEREFTIEDIFVYPQEVTGSTVNTNQESYTKWLYALPDEVFNNVRMQGHSHVNMGISPSGVDDNHRKQILEQLDSDMFYIFQIWNKSLSVHTLIYDMANNILYENKDIEVKHIIEPDMDEFLTDAKAKVQSRCAAKKQKKSKKQEQLELEEALAELAEIENDSGYPFSRSNFRDSFFVGGELFRC